MARRRPHFIRHGILLLEHRPTTWIEIFRSIKKRTAHYKKNQAMKIFQSALKIKLSLNIGIQKIIPPHGGT